MLILMLMLGGGGCRAGSMLGARPDGPLASKDAGAGAVLLFDAVRDKRDAGRLLEAPGPTGSALSGASPPAGPETGSKGA